MRQYAILRFLLAIFFLYYAWPYIPVASTDLERLFWGVWLGLLVLVLGGNLATVLQIKPEITLGQVEEKIRKTVKD